MSPDGQPTDGTYYSTNAGGTWTSTRISKVIGAQSLTLDPSRGSVVALVSRGPGLELHVKPADAGWTRETVTTGDAWAGVVRVNPVIGSWFVAYVFASDGSGATSVRVRSKG